MDTEQTQADGARTERQDHRDDDQNSTVIIEGVRHLPPRRSDLYSLGQWGYVLDKKIGEGTYARVHKAYYYDTIKGSKLLLACKIFNLKEAPKKFRSLFFPRELSIIATLKHPHVLTVHSILSRGEKFFVFMKYAEKGDLLTYIKKRGALKENHAKIWYGQLLSAIEYLHSRNIAHRDLKCENIVITTCYNIKVGDYGFATIYEDDVKSRTFCGSLAYACPEITRGIPYRPKMADYWSSGIVLFIMLNGTMPFREQNIAKLVSCQMDRRYKHQYRRKDQLSGDAIHLIDRILEPNLRRRYSLRKIKADPWLKDVAVTKTDLDKLEKCPDMKDYFGKLITESMALFVENEDEEETPKKNDASKRTRIKYKDNVNEVFNQIVKKPMKQEKAEEKPIQPQKFSEKMWKLVDYRRFSELQTFRKTKDTHKGSQHLRGDNLELDERFKKENWEISSAVKKLNKMKSDQVKATDRDSIRRQLRLMKEDMTLNKASAWT